MKDTQLSIDYIRSYRGTLDLLDASLQRICAAAARLTAELEAIQLSYPSEGIS